MLAAALRGVRFWVQCFPIGPEYNYTKESVEVGLGSQFIESIDKPPVLLMGAKVRQIR